MDWSTRYVYNGADDDILPEDNVEYGEDTKSVKEDVKESARVYHSDEYLRRSKTRSRKRADKGRSKVKPDYEDIDRRKRSVANENINENIINGTFNDKVNEKLINVTNDRLTVTTSKVEDETTTDLTNITYTTQTTEMFRIIKVTSKPTMASKSFMAARPNRWSKPTKVFVDFGKESEEVGSDEADFSSNMKKRLPRKNNLRKTKKVKPVSELMTDDEEDGITKSIYEMYYKTKPRLSSFKPFLRSSEEEPRHRKKNKNIRKFRSNEDYRSTEVRKDETFRHVEDMRRTQKNSRRREKIKADMPFFLTSGRRLDMKREESAERKRNQFVSEKKNAQDMAPNAELARLRASRGEDEPEYEAPVDFDDDETEMENVYRQPNEQRHDRRMKRAMPPPLEEPSPEPPGSEQTETEEPDYVITLRPTQIRTFVIWFEKNKKPYT